MARAAEFQGEEVRIDHFARKHTAQRDLGRRDEAQVRVLDRVDLRLVPARIEAGPLEDRLLRKVRGAHRGEAVTDQRVHRVHLKRQVENDRLVLQEVEAGTGHTRTGLEVDQVELLAKLDVVQRLKIELGERSGAAHQLQIVFIVDPDRRVRVRHVRDGRVNDVQLRRDLLEFLVHAGFLGAERFALLLELVALVFVLGLSDGFGKLVRLAVQVLGLLLQVLTHIFQLDEAVQFDVHVAIDAVLTHRFQIFQNEFTVQHKIRSFCKNEKGN